MKNFLPVLIVMLLIASCKKVEKDVNNYFPKVKTVSAVVQPDGTVKLVGELMSEGAGEMRGVGFCMDTLPNPKMNVDQKICDTLFGNFFSASYSYLDATRPYYVRAWAVNEHGHVYGEDILVNDIKISHAAMPCAPDSNTVAIEYIGVSTVNSYSRIEFSTGNRRFQIYAGSHILRFEFFITPVTGKWKITSNSSGSHLRLVNILYSGPSTSGAYAETGDVYVNQMGPGVYEMTVCDVQIPTWSGERKLSARFTIKE